MAIVTKTPVLTYRRGQGLRECKHPGGGEHASVAGVDRLTR